MKKNKPITMDKISPELSKHSAQRSSELTHDYLVYLTDYAKLHNIDVADFLLNNLVAFPSSVATYLLVHEQMLFTAEEFLEALTKFYDLDDDKDKHYFIHGLEEMLNGCQN